MTRYVLIPIKGSKPTKKNPNAPKITATQALADFLYSYQYEVVSVLPQGFGGFLVIGKQG